MSRIVRPEKVSIKDHADITEKFIQNMISEDPSIIGLGDLVLKDKERMQPRAGRLDLLLMDPESTRRYEVEIQLGKTDESHIIRTIEYWDIERKRYPQYDHCAVIVAEDITSRFLNVINLFNGFIPLIAIQMNAYKFNDDVGLVFTKVLDEMPLGLIEEDEENAVEAIANREYWIKKGFSETIKIADKFLEVINETGRSYELQYHKGKIPIKKNGQFSSFMALRPRKKNYVVLILKHIKSEDIDAVIEEHDLDYMEYNSRASRYRIKIHMDDLAKKKDAILSLISLVEQEYNE
jgi:hypothetical protein